VRHSRHWSIALILPMPPWKTGPNSHLPTIGRLLQLQLISEKVGHFAEFQPLSVLGIVVEVYPDYA
jgi:hypothetical protein